MQKNRLGNFPTRFIIEPLINTRSRRIFYDFYADMTSKCKKQTHIKLEI